MTYQSGRSMTYGQRDRARHYQGTVARSHCPVCLMGMGSSHGHSEVDYTMPASTPTVSPFVQLAQSGRLPAKEYGR